MADPPRTPVGDRKRARQKNMESRYFPSPKRQKAASRHLHEQEEVAQLLALPSPTRTTRSRFFSVSTADSSELLANLGFACFHDEVVHALHELYQAKPILIQEHVSASPWKVLVAVTLLNKTAGNKSIPVFFEIMDRWPTPAALAEAPMSLLHEMIKDLGLGEMRSSRLVALSQSFLADPPLPGQLRRSRGKLHLPSPYGSGTKEIQYPPTPVSHIPGCGPYALDSYRIFCMDKDEWKAVRPRDKELIKYLQWKWAIEEYREWDPLYGPGDTIDLDYVRSLTSSLAVDISH